MSLVVREWTLALLVVAGALVLGWALDWVINRLLRHQSGPAHRARGAVARALRGQPEIWVVLLATAIARPFDFVPPSTLRWIDRLVLVLAVLSVTLFLARLAGSLIRAYLSKESVDAPSGSIFVNLSRLLIWAVGLTVMLGVLGVQIGPLVASLGVVGLAVSLGAQDTLANFFSGLQITMSRQIQPGQYIRLSTGESGAVTDVTWRNTTMRSAKNDLVIVPNSVIARSLITNFTTDEEEHAVVIPFTVAYGSDLEEVERIGLSVLREVRDEMEEAVQDAEPLCRFPGYENAGVSAILIIRVYRYEEQWALTSAIVQRFHARLTERGIKFGSCAVQGPS